MGQGLIGKIGQQYEKYGAGRTLIWIITKTLKKILKRIYYRVDYGFWSLSLDKIAEEVGSPNENYHCRRMQREDLGTLEKKFGKRAEDFTKRMELSTCYLLFNKTEVIGYSWSCHKTLKHEGIKPFFFDIYLKNQSIYFYNDYVLTEKRGRSVGKKLQRHRLSESKRAGFKKAFGVVEKKQT